MKKIKNFKLIPAIAVGILLLVSAITFPVLAEKFQVKGMERAAKNLEINSSKMSDITVEKAQDETGVKDIINMTEKEEKIFDDIALIIQKSTLIRTPESRKLSDDESNRMVELRKKFMTGEVKSKRTLPIGENLERPYFNPENETYYYPEGEMTDEQLLQIIDFNEKLKRAFSKLYEEYIQNVMENSDVKITEEEAIKIAKETIERVYDVSLDNMKSICSFTVDEYHNEKSWRIIFEPENLNILKEQKKLYWIYFANVDIYNGKVDFVDSFYSDQREETKKSEKTNLNKIDEHKNIGEEVLRNRLNAENIEFLKAYVKKSNIIHSSDKLLNLVYKAENRYIQIEFVYGSKRIVSLFFYDDPIRLDEKINKTKEDSIGSIMVNRVATIDDNGRRIPANSQVLQLKNGAKIVALEGDIEYNPEDSLIPQQKRMSDEIFENTGMRIEFKIGVIKYEPKGKIDTTKIKLDIVDKYPFEGNLKGLKAEEVLPYKFKKGTFAAQSGKDFEAEFYLEDGQYGGKVESEFDHDTRQYKLETKISDVDHYLVVLKNESDEDEIDLKYDVSKL